MNVRNLVDVVVATVGTRVHSFEWWCWLSTAALLTAGLSGWLAGFGFAVAMTAIHLAHDLLRDRRIGSFAVQVKLGYLLILLALTPRPLRFLGWLPALGTWGSVLFDYCLLAWTTSLLPWNRRDTLSWALVRLTFLSPPVRGSFVGAGDGASRNAEAGAVNHRSRRAHVDAPHRRGNRAPSRRIRA